MALPDEPDPDGARWLLALLLDRDPARYVEHAGESFEREVDPEAVAALYAGAPLTAALVAALYAGAPLTAALVAALDPERDPDAALAEAAMGHPVA